MKEPSRIADLIERQRRSWPRTAPPGAARAAELAEAWRQAVGDQVAANAMPARQAGDTLVISCASATWAGELTLLQRTVLDQLRRALGADAPARLRFVVGELPEPVARPRPPAPRREPSAADERAARAVAERVSDPELRAAVERVLAAALARQSGGVLPPEGADRAL